MRNWLIIITTLLLGFSCNKPKADAERTVLLEVEGRFLYKDQVEAIIPPNMMGDDSTAIAQKYMRKWATDILLFENAKRNITNKAEIEQLLEEYRRSLIIHQYQQGLIAQRLPTEPAESEMQIFYEAYSDQFTLKENIIKGIFLVIPVNAPQKANVRNWVKSGNTKSLESIEKYSMQHAISYDYFGNNWIPFSDVLRKMPIQLEDAASFVANNKFVEANDSIATYLLKIESFRTIGQTEPFDMARPKIANIMMNKKKADFIASFEDELYEDAIKKGNIVFFE